MRGLFDTLIKAFRLPDLRKKILYTLLILAVYQVGGLIPVPGLDREIFSSLVRGWGQLGSMMDIITGGGLYATTIFAMGISPYINASIIIQLLTVVIPALENLAKEGEAGRKKMTKINRTGIHSVLPFLLLNTFCYDHIDPQVALRHPCNRLIYCRYMFCYLARREDQREGNRKRYIIAYLLRYRHKTSGHGNEPYEQVN